LNHHHAGARAITRFSIMLFSSFTGNDTLIHTNSYSYSNSKGNTVVYLP
jgi:hypothetical protein